jgi:putative RNA 2'-phosphotransferase
MMKKTTELTTISKFMSLVLRHQPQKIGLVLDPAGWASVDDLLRLSAAAGRPFTHDDLVDVVMTSDKQRFALGEDGLRIRANQGHTVDVELDLAALVPPDVLFHGTARRFLDAILREGLSRRARHHVHLTANRDTAIAVGTRYGAPALLRIDAARMHADGHVFRCSANAVCLAEAVPARYLETLK